MAHHERFVVEQAGLTSGSLCDVAGLTLGHAQRVSKGWRTGTTVVIAPLGAVGGVDVRGGGPGTHETDLLRPENLVQQVHAICLTGGSAYGLAAVTGVMAELERRGVGFPVGLDGAGVVPIVPAAVIYDLARGGVFANRPDAGFGERAARSARSNQRRIGSIGAGTGAVAGGLQGGIGMASTTLANGTVVAALAVVNSAGTVIDPASGLPWEHDGLGLRRPARSERASIAALLTVPRTPLNTTIGVVATDATLNKAECSKFADVAHDGMARAIRPAHTLFDGDTIFSLATGVRPLDIAGGDSALISPVQESRRRAVALNAVFEAGARCFAMACSRAVIAASSWPGGPPSYRDLCSSAFPSGL